MATNPAIERAKLFAILQSDDPQSMVVFNETSGEIQLVATGPGAGQRTTVRLKPQRSTDLLQFAPITWWQTSASTNELVNAIENSWISVPEEVVGAPVPSAVVSAEEQLHEYILWLQTAVPQVAPSGRARMHFDGVNLRLSQDGGPFVNVVDPVTVLTLQYAATVNLDFSATLPVYRSITLAGDLTLTGSNYGLGRQVSLRIVADGSTRTLTFPAGWTFIGAAAPADIAAGKTAILSMTTYGSTEGDVVAAYSVEP